MVNVKYHRYSKEKLMLSQQLLDSLVVVGYDDDDRTDDPDWDQILLPVHRKCWTMVNEFWTISYSNSDTNDSSIVVEEEQEVLWQTLPQRIRTLVSCMVEVVEIIHSKRNADRTTTMMAMTMSTNSMMNPTTPDDLLIDLSTIITASLLVHEQQQPDHHGKQSTNRFIRSFENFFVAALMYHCTTTTVHNHIDDESSLLLLESNNTDDSNLLQHLFGDTSSSSSSSQNNKEELKVFFSNLRRLGWIQPFPPPRTTSIAETMSSSTSSSCISSKSTIRGSLLLLLLLHEPLMVAVHKIITKQVRAMIVGKYDDTMTDSLHNDENDDTTKQTTSFQFIIHWANQTIVPWLCHDVFGIDHEDIINDSTSTMEHEIRERVQLMIVQTYWSIRLQEIFDIVTSYPDSLPAIMELKLILHMHVQHSVKQQRRPSSSSSSSRHQNEILVDNVAMKNHYEQLIQELSQSLRNSFIVRLNHPGANTTQMIDVYIAAIQVLRKLLQSDDNNSIDIVSVLPSFMISSNHMNAVIAYTTEPVRSYLRNYRNDTVRCILTSLTSTGSTGSKISDSTTNTNTDSNSNHVLYQELRRQDTRPLEYMTMNSDDEDDDEEECPTMDWQPRPSIYSHTHQQQQQQRQSYHRGSSSTGSTKNESDILAMLVSIYGSKELFVNEYRSMLADKLLGSNYDDDNTTDRDIHTLELLKLRFGEMSLINAEVMIKDIEDSARINKNIRDAYITKKKSSVSSSDAVVVDASIVSHIFWPKLQTSALKHHPRIQILLDEYAMIYAEQKNPRLLQWYNHLGSMQLELDVVEERRDERTGNVSTTVETKEFTCSPLLATLVSHFEDEPIWTAEQLSNETNVPDHIIVKQMTYWVTERVVTYRPAKNAATLTSTYDISKSTYTLASTTARNESTR